MAVQACLAARVRQRCLRHLPGSCEQALAIRRLLQLGSNGPFSCIDGRAVPAVPLPLRPGAPLRPLLLLVSSRLAHQLRENLCVGST